jgi:hypothetical protein
MSKSSSSAAENSFVFDNFFLNLSSAEVALPAGSFPPAQEGKKLCNERSDCVGFATVNEREIMSDETLLSMSQNDCAIDQRQCEKAKVFPEIYPLI